MLLDNIIMQSLNEENMDSKDRSEMICWTWARGAPFSFGSELTDSLYDAQLKVVFYIKTTLIKLQ